MRNSKLEKGKKYQLDITKILVCMAILVFIILLIPIFNIADVNHATGDDYGYAIRTRHAWVTTHSIWQLIKAAGETVYSTYFSWQGTWFDVFLFSLQPEVFHENAYVVVPFIMVFLWVGSTFYLLKEVLMNKLGINVWDYCLFTIAFLIINIEYIPGTKSSIFWYNGTTHYMVPFVICQMLVAYLLKYSDNYKKRYLIKCMILMSLLGGANYQAALLALISVVYIMVYDFVKKKNKHIFKLLIPICFLLIGLIISMKAPGNKNRGGDGFGFSAKKVINTVLQSFVRGTTDIVKYLLKDPLVLIGLIFLFVLCIVIFSRMKNIPRISHGIVVILALYCAHCAMYAPEIFAGVSVSQGVENTNYQVLLLTLCGSFIVIANILVQKVSWFRKNANKYIFIPGIIICFILVFIFRGDIKESTSWKCYQYKESGRAEIYKKQMDYWLSLLLNDDLDRIILPMINDDQGPLMFMPVINDADAWTNSVTRNFYGKTYLIAIPRDEWIELYGTPVIGNIPE